MTVPPFNYEQICRFSCICQPLNGRVQHRSFDVGASYQEPFSLLLVCLTVGYANTWLRFARRTDVDVVFVVSLSISVSM